MKTSKNNSKSIGIFDSGIGGLTVTKEIIKRIPNENFIYLGDTARVPYGTKSKITVIKYAESNTWFLISKGIKLLVVACNTASAYSLDTLKEKFKLPIVGVIKPGAKKAVSITKKGNIGVIGTPSTIKSNAYINSIKEINPDIEVFSKACPLFVPFAEEGWTKGDIIIQVAKKYLLPLKKNNIDVLILGCTHYPLLKNAIRKVMGDDIELVDSAEETAKEISRYIANNKIENNDEKKIRREFYLTDDSETFLKIAARFLGKEIKKIKTVDLIK